MVRTSNVLHLTGVKWPLTNAELRGKKLGIGFPHPTHR
jgi:hypothetical protein